MSTPVEPLAQSARAILPILLQREGAGHAFPRPLFFPYPEFRITLLLAIERPGPEREQGSCVGTRGAHRGCTEASHTEA